MIKTAYFVVCLFSLLVLSSFSRTGEFPVLKGPYLGQQVPGMTPQIFAPGIVSTSGHEYAPTFTPDGNDLYYGHFRRHEQIPFINDNYRTFPEDRTIVGHSI